MMALSLRDLAIPRNRKKAGRPGRERARARRSRGCGKRGRQSPEQAASCRSWARDSHRGILVRESPNLAFVLRSLWLP